jgi:hypothetical protein
VDRNRLENGFLIAIFLAFILALFVAIALFRGW